ncbi:MAG: magnesium transporter CorA family protein [Coprothermobacterota bacterium]|nr:magnesium transporter CorA family protein [Coprothermobacterota bacterium]
MIKAMRTIGGELVPVSDLAERNAWINMVNPTEDEIARVAEETHIHPDFLKPALDEEERPRIEADEGQILILIKAPIIRRLDGNFICDTVPLGIVATENTIVTVSLLENEVLKEFETAKPPTCHTAKRTRFVLQILFKTAAQYLKYLRLIDQKSDEIEHQLQKSMKNEELTRLLNLEKSLVYFTTSLRANEIVFERLLRSQLSRTPEAATTTQVLKMYEEDQDLLEDVIIENKQAIEMSETYSNILSNTMDAYASIISNNLNIVIKFLTSMTIILALPTMIASFYGMNVGLPLSEHPLSFWIILGISIVIGGVAVYFLKKRQML